MDLGTIIGIICGFACIATAVMSGGTAKIFIHIPSMLITVGGMLSATLIHFSLGQVLRILPVVKKTLFHRLPGQQETIQKMVDLAAVNRRDGALALEQHLEDVDEPFMVRSLQMVIDGQDQESIDEILTNEIHYLQERHASGKKVLDFMGASAPAFGMIGTLIGLVSMLTNLKNPDQIGAGMAVALITTFYGALMANLVFIPLAGKLATRSKQERLLREMVLQGTLAIVAGESPSSVREKMQTFLSSRAREELTPGDSVQPAQSKAA